MGRLLRGADRLLLNPWTTRWGGVEAIVGGGVIAAGFVGGVVTLVLGFPTIWAVLTAVGAFLLGGTGVATLIEHHRSTGENRSRTPTPTALAQIAEELEAAQHVLASHDAGEFFVRHQLAVAKWEQYGPELASQPTLHKEVRAAYRAIDAVNNRGITRGLVTGRGVRTAMVDPTRADEALSAIEPALAALEASPD